MKVLRIISDKLAGKEIKKFIKIKKKGHPTIDDFEVMDALNLPIEQVDKILEKLEKEGYIGSERK